MGAKAGFPLSLPFAGRLPIRKQFPKGQKNLCHATRRNTG
jgi:hypothetical protein